MPPPIRYTRRMLLCTVRDCHLPLARAEGRQPAAGLSPRTFLRRGAQRLYQSAAAARPPVQAARRHACGRGRSPALARSRSHRAAAPRDRRDGASLAAETSFSTPDAVTASILVSLARQSGCAVHGVDISIPAVEAAARRYRPGSPDANGSSPTPIDLCPTPIARFPSSCRSRAA